MLYFPSTVIDRLGIFGFTKLMNNANILQLIKEMSVSEVEGASLTQVVRQIDPNLNDYRKSDKFVEIVVQLEKDGLIESVDSENSRLTELGKQQIV